jgi:hypothetical protein
MSIENDEDEEASDKNSENNENNLNAPILWPVLQEHESVMDFYNDNDNNDEKIYEDLCYVTFSSNLTEVNMLKLVDVFPFLNVLYFCLIVLHFCGLYQSHLLFFIISLQVGCY